MKLNQNDIQQMIQKLEKTKENLKAIDGAHSYSFKEVFTDEFVSQHTKFQNISDFLESSGLDFSSQESFRNIDVNQLDKYISENSDFASWEEMKSAAGKLFIASKINS